MNLSDWAGYDQRREDRILANMCGQCQDGAMPLSSYLLIHHDSKLSSDDVKTLCEWTTAERQRLASSARASL